MHIHIHAIHIHIHAQLYHIHTYKHTYMHHLYIHLYTTCLGRVTAHWSQELVYDPEQANQLFLPALESWAETQRDRGSWVIGKQCSWENILSDWYLWAACFLSRLCLVNQLFLLCRKLHSRLKILLFYPHKSIYVVCHQRVLIDINRLVGLASTSDGAHSSENCGQWNAESKEGVFCCFVITLSMG